LDDGLSIIGFSMVGGAIGTGLTIIEIAIIQAVCVLCVIGFVLDLAILGIGVFLMRGDG
jgi:hypothetical protein